MPTDAAAALVALVPGASTLALAAVCFIAGSLCPTYYAQERFRGFGRAMVDKLPYRPPPGMEESEALAAALESAEEAETQEPEGNQ